jgi:hypothetical protein
MLGGINTDLLTPTITVTDGSGKVQSAKLQPGGGTASFSSLSLGPCSVVVQGWLDKELIAEDSTSVEIKSGSGVSTSASPAIWLWVKWVRKIR